MEALGEIFKMKENIFNFVKPLYTIKYTIKYIGVYNKIYNMSVFFQFFAKNFYKTNPYWIQGLI